MVSAQPPTSEPKTILDVLISQGAIDKIAYDKIKLENVNSGKTFEQIIDEKKFVSPEELAKAKAELFNLPFVDLKEISVSPEAIRLLPESVARRYACFPYALDKEKQELSLVMKDPSDLKAIERRSVKLSGKRRLPKLFLLYLILPLRLRPLIFTSNPTKKKRALDTELMVFYMRN